MTKVRRITCEICNQSISIRHVRKHYREHHPNDTPHNLFLCDVCNKSFDNNSQMRYHKQTLCGTKNVASKQPPFICVHCNKLQKNFNALSQHTIRCKLNENRIVNTHNSSAAMLAGRLRTGFTNASTKAAILGLPKPEISAETRLKLSIANKGRVWSDESRLKQSQSMRAAVTKYPDSYSASNVCGRTKIIEYKGINLHGKWELCVAEWLDSNNITWDRNTHTFPYMYNNQIHTYFPDFYLTEYDLYVEVKGHQVERDLYKWQTLDNLIVFKAHEIKLIRNNQLDLSIFTH
jgi:hypothetical protein